MRKFCDRLREVSNVRSLILLTPVSVMPPPQSSKLCSFLKSGTQKSLGQEWPKSMELKPATGAKIFVCNTEESLNYRELEIRKWASRRRQAMP
jgi:hypothetical protein